MTERDEGGVSNFEWWVKWGKRAALGGAAAYAFFHEQQLRRENRNLKAANDLMQFDGVVPDCYTAEGIQTLLDTDEALRNELVGGNAGVIMLDVRALKYLNERVGRPQGDRLLASTGLRMRDAMGDTIRSHPHTVSTERRQPGAPPRDILCRLGRQSDEFVIVARNVSGEQLETMTERIRQRFGIDRAIQDCSEGVMPIVASVASVHASEPRGDGSLAMGFSELVEEVDKRHAPHKTQQYNEMWDRVQEVDPDAARPADDRDIIGAFWAARCSGFEDLIR